MSKIQDLLPKLEAECKKEERMFAGDKEREFFIEMMADSLESLLEMYNPTEHNKKWDEERSKPVPDIETIQLERRAIAFMASGRLGVLRHYWEDELKSHVQGRARMIWNHDMLRRTEWFTEDRQQ
jgi:hypothetical protein